MDNSHNWGRLWTALKKTSSLKILLKNSKNWSLARMLLCCMGECSGQLVRSFLLAVKPQHACTSLFTGHLLYSCPVECVCESAVGCVVELYSQASFLLNAQLHLSYYIRTLLNPPMSWEALTNKATSSKEWIAMGVLAPLCLSCRLTMQINYEKLNPTRHGCVQQL